MEATLPVAAHVGPVACRAGETDFAGTVPAAGPVVEVANLVETRRDEEVRSGHGLSRLPLWLTPMAKDICRLEKKERESRYLVARSHY